MNKKFNKTNFIKYLYPTALSLFVLVIISIVLANIIEDPFKLNTWNYASFIVAAVALYVSFITYKVSMKTLDVTKETLRSQKQTEQNTTPIFSNDSQALVLSRIATQLVDNFCCLSALKNFVTDNTQGHPVPRLFSAMSVNCSSIHLELAYAKPQYFHDLSLLQTSLENYNSILNSIQIVLSKKVSDRRLIVNELQLSRQLSLDLFNDICSLFNLEDSINFYRIKEPLEKMMYAKLSPFSVNMLIDLINRNDDTDRLRSFIPNKALFNEISTSVKEFSGDIRKFIPDLFLSEEELKDFKINENGDKTFWVETILGCISYKYYQNTLKDFMIVPYQFRE